MIRYEKEIKCGFNKLIDFVLYKNKNGIFTLIYNDKSIKAEFLTLFETDNGFYFEEDDPVMKNLMQSILKIQKQVKNF